MIIKSFTADSVAAALKKVRGELGGDAVVLKTRQLFDQGGRNRIEITACLDKPTADQACTTVPDRLTEGTQDRVSVPVSRFNAELPGPSPEDTNTDNLGSGKLVEIGQKLDLLLRMNRAVGDPVGHYNEPLRKLCQVMRDADVDEQFIDTLVARVLETCSNDEMLASEVEKELRSELSSLVSRKIEFKAGDRLLFIGPPGSGKTSVMGKLAAEFVIGAGDKVRLVSLDTGKVGALDEIHGYAELLGADVAEPDQWYVREESKDQAIILIDSPALSPNEKVIRELAEQVERFNPNYRFITLSCLTRSADMVEFVQRIKPLAPTHLILTMLDLTERWGGIIAACRAAGRQLALVTEAPSGKGTAHVPDPALMARKILKMGTDGE